MTRKPEIQYVGQFYVHGSEARKLDTQKEIKKTRTILPIARLEQVPEVYVDPVALIAIAVAVLMLVVMVTGIFQIQEAWQEYETVSYYVHRLNARNRDLTRQYRASYDLEDIRIKAEAMGMIPKTEAKTINLTIQVPQPEPEMTFLENIVWFVTGMFA